MSNKLDMEATLPLETEHAMYRDFFDALRPQHRSNTYEEEFWLRSQTALSNSCSSGDLSDLCRIEPDPGLCSGAEEYFRMAQWSALFRKRDDVGPELARLHSAVKSFFSAEEACRKTNEFIYSLRVGTPLGITRVVPGMFLDVLHSARREIRSIIGPCPSYDELPCYLGPGATTQVVRKWANARVKLGQVFACSESMLPVLVKVLESMPDFIFRDFDGGESASARVEIHDSKLAFVPKSFKTYRSIAVEPWLNSFVQLGLGMAMARKLKGFGLDLSDQTANQNLARRGSIDGSLATVDLSSASDCVSIELVRHLLPDDWWEALVHARSSHLAYEGKRLKLEKFSSMGNGFTFPLQSLIFFTIARAVCRSLGIDYSDVRAYGDDIIVPVQAYGRLESVLTLCGFTVNETKSFSHGPFRESCGADYWQGIDVRPVFIRNRPSFFDLFNIHNGLMRKHRPELAGIVRKYIPDHLVLLGPDGYGDGHLIGYPFPIVRKSSHVRKGWGGFTFDTYTRKGRKSLRPHPGDYLYPSYSIYRRGCSGLEADDRRLRARHTEVIRLLQSDDWWAFLSTSCQADGNTLPGTRGYRRLSIYTLDLASVETR